MGRPNWSLALQIPSPPPPHGGHTTLKGPLIHHRPRFVSPADEGWGGTEEREQRLDTVALSNKQADLKHIEPSAVTSRPFSGLRLG